MDLSGRDLTVCDEDPGPSRRTHQECDVTVLLLRQANGESLIHSLTSPGGCCLQSAAPGHSQPTAPRGARLTPSHSRHEAAPPEEGGEELPRGRCCPRGQEGHSQAPNDELVSETGRPPYSEAQRERMEAMATVTQSPSATSRDRGTATPPTAASQPAPPRPPRPPRQVPAKAPPSRRGPSGDAARRGQQRPGAGPSARPRRFGGPGRARKDRLSRGGAAGAQRRDRRADTAELRPGLRAPEGSAGSCCRRPPRASRAAAVARSSRRTRGGGPRGRRPARPRKRSGRQVRGEAGRGPTWGRARGREPAAAGDTLLTTHASRRGPAWGEEGAAGRRRAGALPYPRRAPGERARSTQRDSRGRRCPGRLPAARPPPRSPLRAGSVGRGGLAWAEAASAGTGTGRAGLNWALGGPASRGRALAGCRVADQSLQSGSIFRAVRCCLPGRRSCRASLGDSDPLLPERFTRVCGRASCATATGLSPGAQPAPTPPDALQPARALVLFAPTVTRACASARVLAAERFRVCPAPSYPGTPGARLPCAPLGTETRQPAPRPRADGGVRPELEGGAAEDRSQVRSPGGPAQDAGRLLRGLRLPKAETPLLVSPRWPCEPALVTLRSVHGTYRPGPEDARRCLLRDLTGQGSGRRLPGRSLLARPLLAQGSQRLWDGSRQRHRRHSRLQPRPVQRPGREEEQGAKVVRRSCLLHFPSPRRRGTASQPEAPGSGGVTVRAEVFCAAGA
ncbi:collagen alpha-1(I) chain-like [Meles meles]|uniref:collagen alpha-1(I) chain-like n=1 Tax=Meles meles TaxID=9662 RepID=UPI001E69C7FA|nr:collagen alpha-1(I) chain-like [Meles meles]